MPPTEDPGRTTNDDRARRRVLRVLGRLRPEEAVGLAFLALLAVLSLVFSKNPALQKTAVNRMLLAAGVVTLVLLLMRKGVRPALHTLRDWLPFALCILIYENLHDLVPLITSRLADPVIAGIDRAVLGVDASVWAERFVSAPLTHVMNTGYSSYYLLPPILAGVLYLQGDRRAFRHVMLGVVFGLYIGYIGYILVPTIGPRYFLADRFSIPLPGDVFHQAVVQRVREAHGGEIMRDCFPSLHAATALTVLGFAVRMRPKLALILAPVVLVLLLATIYLRYHYVVDVVAGSALAFGMIWAAPRIDGVWSRWTGRGEPE